MENLLKKIEENYDIPLDSQYDEKLELEFLQSFLNKFNIKEDPLSIERVTNQELLLAYLCLVDFRMPFQELKKAVGHFKSINNISSFESIKSILTLVFEFNDQHLVDSLSTIEFAKDDIEPRTKEYQAIKEAGLVPQLKKLHSLLKRNIGDTEEARKSFFDLLFNCTNEFFDVFLGMSVIVSIKEDIFVYRKKVEKDPEKDSKITQGFKDIMSLEIDAFTKNKLEKGKIYPLIDNIREREQTLQRMIKAREKKLTTIKEKLKSISFKDTIYFTKSFFTTLPESVRFTLIEYALMRNRDFYLEIEKELQKEEELTLLEQLFKATPFKFSKLTVEDKEYIMSYGNIEHIRKMMSLFGDKKFSFLKNKYFPIRDILVLSNPNIISTISKLLKQNLLSESFVEAHPEIFIDKMDYSFIDDSNIKGGKFKSLLLNIDELRKRKINTNRVSQISPSTLILDSDRLHDSLELIDDYKLEYSKLRNFELFENISLLGYLDQFIELGLYDIVQNDPNLINKKADILIARIKLCIQLGLPIRNEENGKLSSKITDEVFKVGTMPIADDKIKNFIENATSYYEDDEAFKILESTPRKKCDFEMEPEILSRYKENDLAYNINGILVSKNKVLSNYQMLTSCNNSLTEDQIIFNSIIHGSILNSNQLDSISEIFNPNKQKQKRQTF